MTAVTHLLLDADGVVQAPSDGWLTDIAGLCGPGFDHKTFLEAVFAAERPCLRGQADFATALAQTLKDFDSPCSSADALRVWTQIDPAPEIFALLPEITVPVGLATNQQAHRALHMTSKLNYADHFDQLFISCELGYAKPEPAYFQAVIERLDTQADKLLFIDDHQANVDAARDHGLKAEQFDLKNGVDKLRGILRDYHLIDV